MNTLSRLIDAQKKKALRQAYDQNKAKLGENDAATQRYASQVNKAVADLNRFENELKQVNRQAQQTALDKLNNSLKSLQAEFQAVTTGMHGYTNATEQTRAKIDVLSRMVDKQKEKMRELQSAYNRAKPKKEKRVNQHNVTQNKFIGLPLNLIDLKLNYVSRIMN